MSNNSIRYFRHALALDEHRGKFHPSYYKQSRVHDEAAIADVLEEQPPNEQHPRTMTEATVVSSPPVTPAAAAFKKVESEIVRPGMKKGPKRSREFSQAYLFENELNRENGQETDSLEVWFAGVHTGAFAKALGYTINSSS
jgi:hypothetical protein